MVLVEAVSGAPRYPLRTAADVVAVLDRVQAEAGAAGYGGHVGLEYVPSGASADSFAWLPYDQRSARP